MRRVGQLYEHFCSFGHLLAAYRRARRGTRHNEETSAWFFYLEYELLKLQEELLTLSYQPSAYRYFQIHDPKERTISVAPFRDRVVHHALVGVLEPIYERCFIDHSYATRKGKGVHLAVAQAQLGLKRSPWFLKTDIHKYFDSIQHQTLLDLIGRKIKDPRLLDLTARIIHNGGNRDAGIGLPIGNLTSQFFANVYLNGFDHFVKQTLGVQSYVRYMDDFVLFAADRSVLKVWRSGVESYLIDNLGLQLKPGATYLNSGANGLTFLGRRVFPNAIRLANPNLRRMCRRIKQRKREYETGKITEEIWLQSMNSYWANLCHGGNWRLRSSLLQE